MARDWMADLLTQTEARRANARLQAHMHQVATEKTGEMLAKLRERMKSDIERYAAGTGHSLTFTAQEEQSFEVRGDEFPAVFIRLEAGSAAIKVRTSVKKSATANERFSDLTIEIIAKAQDNLYYRIKGDDFRDVGDVSETLLSPLLSRLD